MSASGFEKTASPFTVLVFSVRKPGLTFEEYKSYYENNHVPLVARLLKGEQSFETYTRHYIDRSKEGALPIGNGDGLGYDCVARSEYANKETWEAMLESFKEHHDEIDADEKKFIDQSKMVIVVSGEGPSLVKG